MIVGLYQSTAALAALERWQQTTAQNISASQVPGFKRQLVQVTAESNGEVRSGRLKPDEFNPSSFPLAKIRRDFTAGEMTQTRRELDVGLAQDGFLSVRLADGREGFTRAGQLSLRGDRTLITADNLEVLSQGRNPIQLQADGAVTIDADGTISQAGGVIAALAVSRFADPQALEAISGGVYVAAPGANPIAVTEGGIMQGCLEASNISTMREMVDLVTISRAYEANQKIISTRDQMLQRTLDTLG